MSSSYVNSNHHVIIRTLDQEPLITAKHRDPLCRYIQGILRRHDSRALWIDGTDNHLHLLLSLPAEKSIAGIMRVTKSNSSKWMNRTIYHASRFGWQPGYAAFTASSSQLLKIRAFIQGQEAFHRRFSLEHEYRRILERHSLNPVDPDSGFERDTHVWSAFHLVWSTKNRRPLITPQLEARTFQTMTELITRQKGRVLEIGGMPDHVHVLAEIPRTMSVAELLQKIKSRSSPRLYDDPSLPFAWQRGYGAFSVSRSQVPVVARYIRRQKEHHRSTSFDDEFRSLLAEHGLEFQGVGRVEERE